MARRRTSDSLTEGLLLKPIKRSRSDQSLDTSHLAASAQHDCSLAVQYGGSTLRVPLSPFIPRGRASPLPVVFSDGSSCNSLISLGSDSTRCSSGAMQSLLSAVHLAAHGGPPAAGQQGARVPGQLTSPSSRPAEAGGGAPTTMMASASAVSLTGHLVRGYSADSLDADAGGVPTPGPGGAPADVAAARDGSAGGVGSSGGAAGGQAPGHARTPQAAAAAAAFAGAPDRQSQPAPGGDAAGPSGSAFSFSQWQAAQAPAAGAGVAADAGVVLAPALSLGDGAPASTSIPRSVRTSQQQAGGKTDATSWSGAVWTPQPVASEQASGEQAPGEHGFGGGGGRQSRTAVHGAQSARLSRQPPRQRTSEQASDWRRRQHCLPSRL